MKQISLAILIIFGWCLKTVAAPVPAAQVMDAVLVLYSGDGRERFLGSGFVYRDGRTAVSNAHVVKGQARLVAVAASGTRYVATVTRVDKARDLAELTLDRAHPAVLKAGSAPELGAQVYAAGAPLEATFSLTEGIISVKARQVEPTEPLRYLQHSAPVNPGSSGGPLVNASGALVGVNTRIADGSRFFFGIAYAISVEDLEHFLNARSDWQPPQPGFRVRALSAPIKAALGVTGAGVLVDHVSAGSAAARAGLRAGDILTAMGDTPISQPGDIAFALYALGSQYTLHVLRDGAALALVAELETKTRALVPLSAKVTPERTLSYDLASLGIEIDGAGRIVKMLETGKGFAEGLSEGDVILKVNGQAAQDLAQMSFDAPFVLLVRLADGSTQHFLMDPWQTHGFRPSGGANVMDEEVVRFD